MAETQISLPLSYAEKAEIERRAKRKGKKPSQFLRDLALQGFHPQERSAGVVADAMVGSPLALQAEQVDENDLRNLRDALRGARSS